ncbi:hypothetical protein VTK73DRAFT_4603 [Phialemonium thermophilum]|uniref:FAD-binding FR-type domain-containing protein n=1 Tax=Phialemonium thermophilum TaxID=223376 RepID=A0ABR3XZS7_9PEZI
MKSESTGHLERTANQPRAPTLHKVRIRSIQEPNDNIRILQLEIPDHGTIGFLPGQWLDVYVPGVPKAGGFTITSPPSKAKPSSEGSPGYLELAIQKSPDNAPAAWLWQPRERVLGSELEVRVGGSFVWPPSGVAVHTLRTAVFVAGGVGINPLMSMLSAIAERPCSFEVDLLYSVRVKPVDGASSDIATAKILFLERIAGLFGEGKIRGTLKLFLTGGLGDGKGTIFYNGTHVHFEKRRLTIDDVAHAVGPDQRLSVVYVCGVPTMTDEVVERLTSPDGLDMEPHRVLCEKWW